MKDEKEKPVRSQLVTLTEIAELADVRRGCWPCCSRRRADGALGIEVSDLGSHRPE